MNATAFQPPVIVDILNRRLVEHFQVDGQMMTVWEEDALDILEQRWLLTVCESDGMREVANWVYLERMKSNV